MNDVTEFVAAVVAIAKDPKAFEKRLGDVAEAAEKLAEARRLRKEADEIRGRGQADLEAAEYARGQADRAANIAGQQSTANANREKELDARERNLKAREGTQALNEANSKRSLDQREKDLETRERLAAAKLNEASKLMASYDEAKHQAALKLAG
jgi:hypothetical protein